MSRVIIGTFKPSCDCVPRVRIMTADNKLSIWCPECDEYYTVIEADSIPATEEAELIPTIAKVSIHA